MTEQAEGAPPTFEDLGLGKELCSTIAELGYERPTPIQMQSIPLLLEGRDLIAQAQTGTGKTAAFALPLLGRLDFKEREVQILVLTPTRELAIQVAEAFQSYAHRHKTFRVLPIYGGQSIGGQLRQLGRNPQVIVGTPGRVMDHLRRGTLDLGALRSLVVDEADEMLSMGFIEDVEWIMGQAPAEIQTALFSATMPRAIRSIAEKRLRNPAEVVIKQAASEASLIQQSHWVVSGLHKLDALTRILEVSETDGVLVFVRTKTETLELTEKLNARGYSAAPLNGDMSQDLRERTIERFKGGKLDLLVATDVAARGLHVDRLSHVVNYDAPFDVETYTHRIGRTGRAGKEGVAILFVAPREMGLLRNIERSTGKRIPLFKMPSREDVESQRLNRFIGRIEQAFEHPERALFDRLVGAIAEKTGAPLETIASGLLAIANESSPLVFKGPDLPKEERHRPERRVDRGQPRSRGGSFPSGNRPRDGRFGKRAPQDARRGPRTRDRS